MNRVETIEEQVQRLSPQKLVSFREWFARYDADAWDKQFDADVDAGRLDQVAEEALADHEAGRSREL
jgi:hypothetical protein